MGLFGSGMRKPGGIVATPEQEEESRRMAMRLGVPYEFDSGGQQAPQQPQEQPQGYWQGGGKMRGRDGLAIALAGISDAFAPAAGMQGGAVDNLMGGRMDAREVMRRAQEAQIARQQGLKDYDARKQIDQRYAQPETPAIGKNLEYFMGNIMPDPAKLAAFAQYQDYVNPRYAQGADGRQYQQPRGAPQAPVGRLTPLNPGGPASAPGNFRPY